jgi:hypothetical protein
MRHGIPFKKEIAVSTGRIKNFGGLATEATARQSRNPNCFLATETTEATEIQELMRV